MADIAETAPEGGAMMDDSELASLLAAHESRAVGYYNSEIADQQAKAINYYYGIMDDLPALEGCSSVVDHTVAVMVDNALASVLKPFVSADEVVCFEPRGPEDVEMAEQATEYVNYVINCDNPGFLILHNWFKDALLTKLGVVKVWWEDKTRITTQEARVDATGLLQAREQPGYMGEQDNGDGSFTVAIQAEEPDGRECVVNIPPEEFLIDPFTRSIEEASYAAHRPSNVVRSDLIEWGFDRDIVDGLPAFAQGQNEESRTQARYRDEEWFSGTREAIGNDKSRDIIAVMDEYIRVDYDGDGVSELRRVIRVDDTILFNEPVDDIPFAILCPVPMPHKVYGRSIADQAMEGQKVLTAITRQTLDNLYKTNNPRPIVPDTAVNDRTWDDFLDSSPGAAISVKQAGQIEPFVIPFTANYSIEMMEVISQNVEERTGIQRKGNGFNAEALRKNSVDTATEAAIDENSRNERAEMIARIFAETGVKRLFRLILKDLIKHQPKARIIRLRNKFVEMDPSGWNPEMDVTISVGLGVGNKAEQMQQAASVLEMMERLAQTPYAYLVTPEHVHNAAKRFYTASGIKNPDDFIGDPQQMQPPEPQPDPEMAKVQADMQAKQAEMQLRTQEAQVKSELARAEAEAKLQLEREKAALEAQLARDKAMFEAELAREKMQQEIILAREQMQINARIAEQKAAQDAELKKNREGGSLAE
jgi:hypothetical protein